MYTFVDHLAITAPKEWADRAKRWKGGTKDPTKAFLAYVRRHIFDDDPKTREWLFRSYRNGVMDHGVLRDSKIEYALYGRGRRGKEGVKMRKISRQVWTDHYGPIPKNVDIHHKDCNVRNNRISNLIALSKEEHRRWHQDNTCPGRTKKRRGLRVPANVIDKDLYRDVYREIKAGLGNRRWGAYTSQQLVRTYKARGGRLAKSISKAEKQRIYRRRNRRRTRGRRVVLSRK